MNEALITVYTQAARYMIQELLSILAVIKATYEDHHLSNGSLIVDMKLSVGYLSHTKDATFDAYQMRCDVFCCAKGKNKPIELDGPVRFTLKTETEKDAKYSITLLSTTGLRFAKYGNDGVYVYTTLDKDYANPNSLTAAQEQIRKGIRELSASIDNFIRQELYRNYWISHLHNTISEGLAQ